MHPAATSTTSATIDQMLDPLEQESTTGDAGSGGSNRAQGTTETAVEEAAVVEDVIKVVEEVSKKKILPKYEK